MKTLITIFLLISTLASNGQDQQPEEFGFRHITLFYKGDKVDVLIKSKPGEENKRKPLFFFCQGSLPIPLMIRYTSDNKIKIYNVFPFTRPDSLLINYHIAIVSKPYIPLIADEKSLAADLTYTDSTKQFPRAYSMRNTLTYYTSRNINILKYLQKLPYINPGGLVLAGHSEGSSIAAKIAAVYPKISRLIYSGGNPLGRMMTIIARQRAAQTESPGLVDAAFMRWQAIAERPNDTTGSGDSNTTMFEFSYPSPASYLLQLTIPVLVTYGNKDYGLLNSTNYFQLETIRLKRRNFTFKEYNGLEHNFFEVKPTGAIDYDKYNWDKIADDWAQWLN